MERIFSKEQLLEWDILWGGTDEPEGRVVSQEHSGSSRWSQTFDVVFESGGKFWKVEVEKPSTECQECDPFGYQDNIACPEVHQVEKTIKVWEVK